MLDALLSASWRFYPSLALVAAGLVWTVRAVWREREELGRPPTDPGLGHALVRALRGTLGGLALAGIGLGWLYAIGPLVLVSALIGLEELLEISSVIRALRAGERPRRPF